MKKEIHSIVKEHCKHSKQTISGCIEELVETYLSKPTPTNILRVK
jgi:hypothetical protein